ncbi:MAG: DUF642 domain-containing protein [Saprospiraceae bacterium]|nr:DUF642 domain-containing protein [Saprospiraceae bacterium]
MREMGNGIRCFLVWLVSTSFAISQPDCLICCCGPAEELGFPCGDFEEPPLAASGGRIDYSAGQTYCGWLVVSGTISIHHGLHNNLGLGNPNGPSQHLDLNGSSFGIVERTLTGLMSGKQYTITLWYAAHNGAGLATCHALINNGDLLDETWSTSVSGNVDWDQRCLTFIADASSVVLRLEGSSNNPCCGMLIDDMSMWTCDADTQAPIVNNPPPNLISVQCVNEVPPIPLLVVADNCDLDPQIEFVEVVETAPCLIRHIRTWTVEDTCGNVASMEQIIDVVDTEPPVFDVLPQDILVPCGAGVLSEFYNWIQMNGQAIASDQCDQNLEWTVDFLQEPESACLVTTVTFQVTDDCGNSSNATATFTVVDTDPPNLINPAQDKSIHCVVNPQDSLAVWLSQWGGALVDDPCGAIQWSHNFSGDSLAPVLEVTFVATDGCGNSIETFGFFYQVNSSDTLYQIGWSCDPAAIGEDTLFLQNQHGCDSLVITETVLLPSSSNAVQLFTCDPAQAGLDTLHLTNQAGCDSTVYVTTIYTGVYQESQTVQICGSGIPVGYIDRHLRRLRQSVHHPISIRTTGYHPVDRDDLSGQPGRHLCSGDSGSNRLRQYRDPDSHAGAQ